MKIKAKSILGVADTVESTEDLDGILNLSVDDAIQLALRKSANEKLEPIWYEKILAKLGDKEKEVFTLGLASSGIKVMPHVKASVDVESHINRLKKYFQDLVAEQGYISEEDYHEALWDKKINGNVPDKVVGEINAWLMQSMIPLKKKQPRKDISPGYRKKVLDQVKNPNVQKLKASKIKADKNALEDPVSLSDEDDSVIGAFTEKRKDRSNLLTSTGRLLQINDSNGPTTIARWNEQGIRSRIVFFPQTGTLANKVKRRLLTYAPDLEMASSKKQAWLPLEKGDAKAIKNFIDHKSGSGENVFSDGKQLRVATEDHEAVVATWQGERLMTNPPETQFEDVVLSWLFRWQQKVAAHLQSVIAFLEEQAEIHLSKRDKKVIQEFVEQKSAASNLLNSNGNELRIEVPMGGGVIASWVDDKIRIGDLGTRSEQTVVRYLHKIAPTSYFERMAQATDFAGEKSELERAIMSWEPRLKNLKEWIGKVRKAQNFNEIREIWDQLWRTKEDVVMAVDPRKHEYKEFIELDDDDSEPLELSAGERDYNILYLTKKLDDTFMLKDSANFYIGTYPSIEAAQAFCKEMGYECRIDPALRKKNKAGMGGAEGDEDVDKYQQAYNAVGGNINKMVNWLKKNKGVDTTARDELKNAIKDWLDHHKKTAQEEAIDPGALLDFIAKDSYLMSNFRRTYERLRAQGQSYDVIESFFEDMLEDILGDVAPRTLLSTIINVAKQLVNIYQNVSTYDVVEKVDKESGNNYITESELRGLANKY